MAVKQAMSNPLLNISIKGGEWALFSVKGGKSLTLGAVNACWGLVGKAVKKDASIYFEMLFDDSLDDGVKLTLIATGLKHDRTGLSFASRFRNLIPGL